MTVHSIRRRLPVLALLGLWFLPHPEARAEEASDPPNGYLEVTEGVDLAVYRGAVVVFEPTRVEATVDKPKALERLRKKCDKEFWHRFDKRFKLFDGLTDTAPAESVENQPVLRVVIQLTLDEGSGRKRWGMGTLQEYTGLPATALGVGAAKLDILVKFSDAVSGESVAVYSGSATEATSGAWGGGWRKKGFSEGCMLRYRRLAKLLRGEMEGTAS